MLSRAEDRASTWKSILNSNHDPILQVGNYHKRELVQKKPNFLLQRHASPASRKVLRRRNVLSNPVCYLIETFPRQRKWSGILPNMLFGRCSFNRNLKIGHEIGTSL